MSNHKIADYTETDYSGYWTSDERRYFDGIERPIVSALLPEKGVWFADLGCGFGRFKDLYLDRFERVILLDYSEQLLAQAQSELDAEARERVHFVLGDLYHLPICDDALDAAMLVRVFHHLDTPVDALTEIRRVVRRSGSVLFNYYNRRNLREVLRWCINRSGRDPHVMTHENFNDNGLLFYSHPRWMEETLKDLSLGIEEARSAGLFYGKLARLGLRLIPFERLLSRPLGKRALAMEVFLKVVCKSGREFDAPRTGIGDVLACPECGARGLQGNDRVLHCLGCEKDYPIRNGIFDMRVQ